MLAPGLRLSWVVPWVLGELPLQVSLLSIISGKKSTHFLICESQLLSNLTQSHSLAAKLYYFLLVFLNVAVFSGHSKNLL